MNMPHRRRLWVALPTLVACVLACLAGEEASAQGIRRLPPGAEPGAEQLVPARFAPRQDALGFTWDVSPRGVVEDGTDDCFDGGFMLMVNGQQVFGRRPMMTPDGSELVLVGEAQGVQVTRRILVDTARSAVRYLEVFRNQMPREMRLSVSVRSTLGGPCERVITSNGAPFARELGKRDCGFMAVQTDQRPSVMFLVADPRSKCKPAIENQENRTLSATYQIALKPQQTVSILHLGAQRRGVTEANVAAVFKAFFRGKLVNPQIPKDLRATVINFATGPGAADEAEPGVVLQPLLDAIRGLDVERGKADVLVLDEETRLTGAASCDGFKVETPFGKADVALGDVGLLWGGAGVGRPTRLYLRTGEVLAGRIEAKGLKFKTEGGLEVNLSADQVDALVTRVDPKDGQAPAEVGAFLASHLGDHLALARDKAMTLEAATAWGRVKVPLDQLDHLSYVREPQPGHRLLMMDKTRLSVILRGEQIEAKSLRFGDVKLAPTEIAGLSRVRTQPKAKGEDEGADAAEPGEIESPHFVLAGENFLVGTFDLPELRVVTAVGVTALDPKKIKSLERRDAEEGGGVPSFTIELAGGGKLAGRLEERVLPIRWADQVLRVPVQHLISFQTPEKAEPPPKEVKPDKGEKGEF